MNKKAFTLLEMLIAITIASFIFIVLTQSLRQSVRFLSLGGRFSNSDRTAALLLDQLEEDLSTAYIPKLNQKNGTIKFPKSPFRASSNEEILNREKWPLFSSLNFITTNPLLVYNKIKPRLVRVLYKLVKNKNKDTILYDVYRKETPNLDNINLETPESRKEKPVYDYKVAEGVKEFYMRYAFIDGDQIKYVDVWDKNTLPHHIKVKLVLKDNVYETIIDFINKDEQKK